MNEVTSYIEKYRAWGLCLIPIAPRAKNPLVKWQQYQHRKPTETELSTWFSSNSSNIAIVCGAISGNLVVTDIEKENQDLYIAISEYCQERFGKKIDELTPVVKTGGGGYHIYWRVKNLPQLYHPAGEERKHIPDIQSEGGYVLAPPSIHPSGNPYRLLNPGITGIYTIQSLSDLAIDIPIKRGPVPRTGSAGGPHWVTEALAGVAKPGRDNMCIRLAGYFRNKHPEDVTTAILLEYGARCNPPLDGATVRKCVKSAYSYEAEDDAEEPSEGPEITPRLPEKAWRGLFADYRNLVAPTTEAADEYHFATFSQVLGCTLGRRVHVYHAGRIYPNFYECLVGRSGLTRKDTCWNRARDILSRLHAEQGDDSPQFRMVRGIRSYEGLLDELSGLHKVRLIQVGELLSLLSKARQDSQNNIVPALTELYDCPDRVNPPVRGRPADCREPFVSIMAGTTQAWLRKALTEADILGGFANRWLFFCGGPKPPKANPPRVDKERRDQLVSAINSIRVWASKLPNEGEITVSAKAEALFEQYYTEYYRRCQNEGLIPTLIVRVQDNVFKLALLYAVIEQSPEITADHMATALAVGEYLEASITDVFRNFGASQTREIETRVLDYLKKAGKLVAERDLYRYLNLSAKDLGAMLQPLARVGVVKRSSVKNKKGRLVVYWESL